MTMSSQFQQKRDGNKSIWGQNLKSWISLLSKISNYFSQTCWNEVASAKMSIFKLHPTQIIISSGSTVFEKEEKSYLYVYICIYVLCASLCLYLNLEMKNAENIRTFQGTKWYAERSLGGAEMAVDYITAIPSSLLIGTRFCSTTGWQCFQGYSWAPVAESWLT